GGTLCDCVWRGWSINSATDSRPLISRPKADFSPCRRWHLYGALTQKPCTVACSPRGSEPSYTARTEGLMRGLVFSSRPGITPSKLRPPRTYSQALYNLSSAPGVNTREVNDESSSYLRILGVGPAMGNWRRVIRWRFATTCD